MFFSADHCSFDSCLQLLTVVDSSFIVFPVVYRYLLFVYIVASLLTSDTYGFLIVLLGCTATFLSWFAMCLLFVCYVLLCFGYVLLGFAMFLLCFVAMFCYVFVRFSNVLFGFRWFSILVRSNAKNLGVVWASKGVAACEPYYIASREKIAKIPLQIANSKGKTFSCRFLLVFIVFP